MIKERSSIGALLNVILARRYPKSEKHQSSL